MRCPTPLAASALIIATVCVGRAASIYDQPGERAGKPFTVSVGLRGEYDDNIYARSGDKTSSWKIGVAPSFLLNLPYERTLLSARYSLNAWYYTDRPGEDIGLSHEFLGRLAHSFSPRCDIDLRNRFAYTYEPDLAYGKGSPNVNGDYLANTASLLFRYQWAPRFGQNIEYVNDYLHYTDDRVGDTQNYISHQVKLENRFQLLPRTVLVVGGAAQDVTYQDFDRGSTLLTAAAGIDQKLLETWVLSVRGGASWLSPDDGSTTVAPYAQLTTSYNYAPNSSAFFGYTHSLALTDIGSYSRSVSDAFQLGVTHSFTPKLALRVSANYSMNNYDQRFLVNGLHYRQEFDEQSLFGDLQFSYAFARYLSAELGYTYTKLWSDFPDRSYDRNRYYFGIRASF